MSTFEILDRDRKCYGAAFYSFELLCEIINLTVVVTAALLMNWMFAVRVPVVIGSTVVIAATLVMNVFNNVSVVYAVTLLELYVNHQRGSSHGSEGGFNAMLDDSHSRAPH